VYKQTLPPGPEVALLRLQPIQQGPSLGGGPRLKRGLGGVDQALSGEQGHLGVIAYDKPPRAVRLRRPYAPLPEFAGDVGYLQELDSIAQGVAHGPSRQAGQSPGRPLGVLRGGPDGQDVLDLWRCLHRAIPRRPDPAQSRRGGLAELGQEAGRHNARSSQPPPAVQEDPSAPDEQVAQLRAREGPGRFEVMVRRVQVADRQMAPLQAGLTHPLAKAGRAQAGELLRFDQGDDDGRPPGDDHRQVGLKVPSPSSSEIAGALLPGGQGHADAAQSRADGVNSQGMGLTRSDQERLLLLTVGASMIVLILHFPLSLVDTRTCPPSATTPPAPPSPPTS